MAVMRFVRTDSAQKTASYLAQVIQAHLDKNQTVLWLVSGGSAVHVAALTSKQLKNMKGLSVTLADERYGPAGHPDSNWHILTKAGFEFDDARWQPILDNRAAGDTAARYEQMINKLLKENDYKVALLGIGPDGHTAGILPGSPATNTDRLVKYYEATDYHRLTLTPKALLKLDEAVVYAQGDAKRQALDKLDQNLPMAVQPAQVLKYIPKVTIFNDIKGEPA